MRKKASIVVVLIVMLATLLVACGDNTATSTTVATTAKSTAVAGTTASGTTAASTTVSGTTASGTNAAATTAKATTAAGTTAAATTASGTGTTAAATGAGMQVDVSGTQVNIKPGGGQKFEPKAPVTIKFWSSQTKVNGQALKGLVDEFMAKNPNIKVEIDNGNDSYTCFCRCQSSLTAQPIHQWPERSQPERTGRLLPTNVGTWYFPAV
jgi:hypothetical protein